MKWRRRKKVKNDGEGEFERARAALKVLHVWEELESSFGGLGAESGRGGASDLALLASVVMVRSI